MVVRIDGTEDGLHKLEVRVLGDKAEPRREFKMDPMPKSHYNSQP